MGLYDDRLADLSESRLPRTAGRAAHARRSQPFRPHEAASGKRSSMRVQSLLFGRDSWTPAKAKAWAKSHGYSSGKIDVTNQYIRIRQFDPKEAKVHRTVPFGRGIRAVVAREEAREGKSMATSRTVNASRKKRGRRKARKSSRKRARRAAPHTVAAPKRRRRKRKATVSEAPRKRRTAKRRRHAKRTHEAWRGDSAGHAKAAKKGHRRRKARRAAARKRPRRASEAPRRSHRRRSHSRRRRSSLVMETPRRHRRRSSKRRSRGMFEASSRSGMSVGTMVVAGLSGGLGFVLADGLDRFLATYNPATTGERPKDKFTSDGAGTLANSLNVASPPGLIRIGASLGVTAVPAVGAMFVKNRYAKTALTGAAFGMGISAFKTIWNGLVMPLFRPKDATPAALQKSFIARLYPAEVSAAINLAKKNADGSARTPQTAVSSSGSGALSGADVGPFALSGDSSYPDAAQALRRETGMQGTPDYPSTQNVWGTGDYPTAAQALTHKTGHVGAPAGHGNPGQPGLSWQPGPPPGPGPGPVDPGKDPTCGCAAPYNPFLGFVEGAPAENAEPLYTTR